MIGIGWQAIGHGDLGTSIVIAKAKHGSLIAVIWAISVVPSFTGKAVSAGQFFRIRKGNAVKSAFGGLEDLPKMK